MQKDLNRARADHTMRCVVCGTGTLEPNARKQGRLKGSVQRLASHLRSGCKRAIMNKQTLQKNVDPPRGK